MATALKKTVAANPAPAAAEAPAPEAVEASVASVSASLTEAAKAFEAPAASLNELQGNLRSVVEKGLSEFARGLRQGEGRGGRSRQRARKQLRRGQGGRRRDQRQGARGPARQRRRQLRFRQIRHRGQERRRLRRAARRIHPQADRRDHRPDQGDRRAGAEARFPDRRADQGTGRQDLQDRRLKNSLRRAACLLPRAVPASPPRLGAAFFFSRLAAARRQFAARALQRSGFDSSFPAVAGPAAIAQLVRALDCGSRGPPFEPGWRYHRTAGPTRARARRCRPSRRHEAATPSPCGYFACQRRVCVPSNPPSRPRAKRPAAAIGASRAPRRVGGRHAATQAVVHASLCAGADRHRPGRAARGL